MWRTTNVELKAAPGGIAFRASKNMNDKLHGARGPDWGDAFPGVDEGDGWVRTVVQVEVEDPSSASQNLKTCGLRRPTKHIDLTSKDDHMLDDTRSADGELR